MAIPLHLQQFKAAGIYRVVFDKSTIVNYDTELLRLVVGYSEQGPFNVPVYVKDPQTFVALFGGINKKLEKRGVFFHRLAIQMLQVSPCLVLNLKKFSNETVGGATISTTFNPTYDPISDVKLKVEDIYDTTRFWTLDAEKLNNLRSVEGLRLDQYINIATTNTKKTSASIFIRKASGQKVSQYNITVNDWYSDNPAAMPDYLENYKNSLMSDFFAEIYVFKGQFTPKQVLASDTLKNYFLVEDTGEEDANGNKILELKLRDKLYNAFGDPIDTLDTMYTDMTSNPLGHYVGCLIPEFKTKNNIYASLDVAFNSDIDIHNMMMAFNSDMLYEYEDASIIDLSGRRSIPTQAALDDNTFQDNGLSLYKIFTGTAVTSVLGNTNAPVVADRISIGTNAFDDNGKPVVPFLANAKNTISGTLYVNEITNSEIKLIQVGTKESVTIQMGLAKEKAVKLFGVILEDNNENTLSSTNLSSYKKEFQTQYEKDNDKIVSNPDTDTEFVSAWETELQKFNIKKGYGTGWDDEIESELDYPEKFIISITNIKNTTVETTYTGNEDSMKVSFLDKQYMTKATPCNPNISDEDSVYGASISFIDFRDENWKWDKVGLVDEKVPEWMYVS